MRTPAMVSQQTITGELRKWRHNDDHIIGRMYHDIHDIYEDGDVAVIYYTDFVESVNFYLAVTPRGCIKCPKDEEIKYAAGSP